MSLSRTPSPDGGDRMGGSSSGDAGWQGGIAKSGRATTKHYPTLKDGGGVRWAAAKERSAKIKSFSPVTTTRPSFFSRHWRNLSATLPKPIVRRDYSEREKLGLGRLKVVDVLKNLLMVILRQLYLLRITLAILLAFTLPYIIFYSTPLHYHYRRAAWLGGGEKFVVILAANIGGGVMEWKGAKEWAIERDSVKNKRMYAKRWGYDLEIVDMATKKRYAHEWRESWEKVDTIRRCMRDYPKAQWFWWLDLNTFIMEPSYSLQSHIFNNLGANTYRDINIHNPLNIKHPPRGDYLDNNTRSLVGDGDPNSIDILVPQDCSGFNLGSFFVRRSTFSDRLLDVWWDPVHYEQKHMQWEHKEQDALEWLYTNQPWIRARTGFLPQRKANSFPPGACGAGGNKSIHYDEKDRDFLVNMAGCEWGRDCWTEMYNYRELSRKLNRGWWQRFKDWVGERWKKKEPVKKQ